MDGHQVRVGQVVIAEVALVGVAVASVGPGWLLLGVGAAAAAVGVATFGRSGGRWWYEAVRSHGRLRRRRRKAAAAVVAATLAARTPPAMVWLRTLAPELAIRAVTFAGTTIGVASDGDGWFGAVAIDTVATNDGAINDWAVNEAAVEPAGLAGLIELVRPGADRIRMSTAQLVRRGRQAWLAVRLSPVDAVAVERTEGGLEAAVAGGVIRATRLLRLHGYEATALDPRELLAALVAANGLDGAPQEHWSAWSSGSLVHTTYAASAWPPEPLLTAPGVWAAAACLEQPVGGVLIRVAAQPASLVAVCRGMARSAARAGIRLRRLDGDQAPAAYACGPSAVPAHGLATARVAHRIDH